MGKHLRPGVRIVAGVAALATAALALAACSSSKESVSATTSASDSAASGPGLPASIDVTSIQPLTGAVAFAGIAANEGYKLAIKEINDQGFLGKSKIDVDYKDSTGVAQTSVSMLTSVIAEKKDAAVFGSVASFEAVALSPIAEKAKMPIIYTQAGSDGILLGDYTFRMTTPLTELYPRLNPFLADKKVKTMAIIYGAWNPTLVQLATKTLPAMASSGGYKITDTVSTPQTITDFTAPVQRVVDGKPDVVALELGGASYPAALTKLHDAGYTGAILANSAMGSANLKPAAAIAKGLTWSTDFNASQSGDSTAKFVKAFNAQYGRDPINYQAESYDAAWLLARALKKANSADPADVQKGLLAVTKEGFTGAMGELKFTDNHDLRVKGVVVEWDGTKESLLKY